MKTDIKISIDPNAVYAGSTVIDLVKALASFSDAITTETIEICSREHSLSLNSKPEPSPPLRG
jgi:hypothetical protein